MKYAFYFLQLGLMTEYYNTEQMLCFYFEQKEWNKLSMIWVCILGHPGADSEGEAKSKRAAKYGTKKRKERHKMRLIFPRINGPIVLPDHFETVAAVLPSDWAEKHVPYFPARLDFLSAPLSAPGSPRMRWVQSSTKTNSLWERTTYDQWKAESIENKLFMPRNHKLQANWNF